MLEVIKKTRELYAVSSYRFVDDALPPRFMRDLARGLIDDGLKIDWMCSIILSRDFINPELCGLLKKSGLTQVSIGLESINPRVLGLMNKCHSNLTREEITSVMSSLKKSGIKVGVHIIFGFPTETVDEARETLGFLVDKRDLYDMCMFQPFCLEDGTPVFNDRERFGITEVHLEDKDSGERLGYRYEVASGMGQKEALDFTYGEALSALKKAGISVRSSGIKPF
jgi:radical SAM superfamily enzyme YgiQ (UPF0313 family)